MIHSAQIVVATDQFAQDLAILLDRLDFRVDVIFPADAPATAIVSGHGVRLRLEAASTPTPILIHLVTDHPGDPVTLPGGTIIDYRPLTSSYVLPENRPSLVISRNTGESGVGRAGMRYRDLIPDRWGGRFIASHITIPDGGPVPDYVHFHKVRFQLIFVKSGWVKVAYEDQGEPFVLRSGDAVIQPPEIRHRVLESSAGLEVIEIGCPAEHETIADWSMSLPTGPGDPGREWDGQRMVRHVAEGEVVPAVADRRREHRDTAIGAATTVWRAFASLGRPARSTRPGSRTTPSSASWSCWTARPRSNRTITGRCAWRTATVLRSPAASSTGCPNRRPAVSCSTSRCRPSSTASPIVERRLRAGC